MNNKIKKYSDYKPITICLEKFSNKDYKRMQDYALKYAHIRENSGEISYHSNLVLAWEKINLEQPFEATLEFNSLGSKRAFMFDRDNKIMYSMTTTDFEALLQDREIPIYPGTKWKCEWYFRKIGTMHSLFHVPSNIEK